MSKFGCKHQELVQNLTSSFKDMKPEEIDNCVSEAKRIAEAEKLEKIKEDLQMRFGMCMQRLKSRYPEPITEIIIQGFRKKWEEKVMSVVAEMDMPVGNIFFLPVIRRELLGIYGLASIIRYKGDPGYTQLDPRKIKDVVYLPEDLYYFAIDVEPGKETQGKSPKDAERIIKGKNRSCLTNDETLSLCIFTNVLSDHYVDATGSRYGDGGVPRVALRDDRPKLDWDLPGCASDHWGSPSARMRI